MEIATILLLMLTGMALLVGIARKIGVPYPILLTIAGLGIGFIPGLPAIELKSELVFLLFLPPILAAAAYFTPVRDFKANLRPILMLSLGLVVFTTLFVGWVLHLLVPGLPLAVCFTLGAIIAPPDAIAATSIAERLGLPHRLVTVLEGESLINDASALICYRFAIAATLTGVFSWSDALGSFAISAFGGIVVGFICGNLITYVSVKVEDATMLILLTLLNSFAAYVIAEHFHLSGVLACVLTGMIYGQKSASVMSPRARIEGEAVWSMVIFIINGMSFILIGLQMPRIIKGLTQTPQEILWATGVAVVSVIVSRIIWMWPAVYLPRLFSKKLRERDPAPPHSWTFVLAWAGMRGIVSLAAALALPENFPFRDLLLFLTFAVVIATLVGQGLSLYVIIPKLKLSNVDNFDQEVAVARVRAAEASLARLKELSREEWVHDEHVEHYERHYQRHHNVHSTRAIGEQNDNVETKLIAMHRLRQELLDAELAAIIDMRNRGEINDHVMRQIQRDFDLEALHRES
jgi:CPA1 family monovalent cation:H+ antiporter